MSEITDEEAKSLHAVIGKMDNALNAIDMIGGIAFRLGEVIAKVERLYTRHDAEQIKTISDRLDSNSEKILYLANELIKIYQGEAGNRGEIRRLEGIIDEIHGLTGE